jgi:trigger factor
VLVEEINKIVGESLNHYFQEEDVKILGEPLPNKEKQPEINWDLNEEFEFVFDIGMAPDIDVTFTKKDKIPYYTIKVDDELRNKYIDQYKRQYGSYEQVDEVKDMKELLTGDITNIDESGNLLEDGVRATQTRLSVEIIKDEDIKNKFVGAKVGDEIDFDVKKAFPNDMEVGGLLQMKKEEVANINPNFRFKIDEISVFKDAEVNQDLFDKIYGKEVVNSEEEFYNKLDQEIADNLVNESEYKFLIDTREAMIDKMKIELPVDFLKRWMKETNEKEITDEQIEKDFDGFEKDLKWQLIKNEIAKNQNLEINKDDLLNKAKEYAMMQYSQYGISNLPDEQLTNFANQILQNEQEARRLAERAIEDKVVAYIKEEVKIDTKEVTIEKFNNMFEQ